MAELEAKALLDQVPAVKDLIDAEDGQNHARVEAALPKHQLSARNLAHCLGLRRRDIRRLQLGLAAAGLSSLGRSEGHVRDTVLRLCAWLSGETNAVPDPLDRTRAEALLHENTYALFGSRSAERHVFIMVTAPGAAQVTPKWATEVLDSAAQTGIPTRAEVTDAAMAMRAECVMLGKGPHIATATEMLADIIHRMEAHQFKRRSMLRPLAVAGVAQ